MGSHCVHGPRMKAARLLLIPWATPCSGSGTTAHPDCLRRLAETLCSETWQAHQHGLIASKLAARQSCASFSPRKDADLRFAANISGAVVTLVISTHAFPVESTCFGRMSSRRLENGVKLPLNGPTFLARSRRTSGGHLGWGGGLAQMSEDRADFRRLGDESNDAQRAAAVGTQQGQNFLYARQQHGPQQARGRAPGAVRSIASGGGERRRHK
jgi:hypothetical protein